MWAMSENEWHGTRTWQHEPSTFLKRETTGSLSSEYYKLYSVANVDDSTRFDSNQTTPHSKWQSVIPDANGHPVWRVVICDDESFDSSQIVSTWQHLQPPFTDTYGIFSKGLANRHPVWRSFDSSRFDNTFNPLSQTLAEYFLSLLQIDFRYAFPCFERWFLRTPVSQHHLAANRFPVWRFAAVWVYWTTLLSY